LTDLDTELEELPVDARRTPERVGVAHRADQLANALVYRSSS
jgi:hypothetical protein